ncbi:MAG: hypothetical protein Ct9H300mP12_07670 [Acidimicrobiales bacterium]|nr:MAG: hypothetical protein Ct9H300mP12_07670 [Acidimicrobiales bacterium]
MDRTGAVYSGRDNLNTAKEWFAEHTNSDRKMGTLQDVLAGTDVFVGLVAQARSMPPICAP